MPFNVSVDDLQTETVTLDSGNSLTVTSNGELNVDGTAVEVETAAQNVNIDVEYGGIIDGSFNGINFLNGGQSQGVINNGGTIASESRAINLGGLFNQVNNFGTIVTTANPRNGTIYSDQTARAFTIENHKYALIDAGRGNQGDAISLQLGASVIGGIVNHGTIRGRGERSATTNSESSAVRLYWGNQSGSPISTFNGDIVNSGRLLAEEGTAILIEDQTVLNGEIRNSGLIRGDFRGINFANGGTSGGRVVNEYGGRILSRQRAINIGGAEVSIENAGRIQTLDSPTDGVIYGDQTAREISINNYKGGYIGSVAGTQGDAISLELGASVIGGIVNHGTIRGRGERSATTNSESSAVRLYWGNQSGSPISTFNGDIVNSGRLLAEEGTAILIEDQTVLNGEIRNSGLIRGDFRGINFANGGTSGGRVVNEYGGRILSRQRAINIGGAEVSIENAGRIQTLDSPTDGVIYGDQTAREISINNQASGVIDVGRGNQGDAISLELGANVEGSIVNAGRIVGRGAVSSTTNSQSSAIRLYWGNQTGEPVSVLNGNIENSGLLASQKGATVLIEDRTQLNGEIINTGFIQGGIYSEGRLAIDASEAEGSLTIANAGRINGDLRLTAGDDTYLGVQGRLRGTVFAGEGNDTLLGGDRKDSFVGGAGDDLLNGGGGRNFLEGGTGSDLLVSGNRRDTFIFGADLLQDTIADLDTIIGFDSFDRLDFSDYLGAGGSIQSVQITSTTQGDSLNIGLSSGDSLSITGDIVAAKNQVSDFV